MQLWQGLWGLLPPAEGLVLLCSSDHSRDQANPEKQLNDIPPVLLAAWSILKPSRYFLFSCGSRL